MKSVFLFLILLIPCFVFCQNPTPTPIVLGTPSLLQKPVSPEMSVENQIQKEILQKRLSSSQGSGNIYGKVSKSSLELVRVDEDLVVKYKEFLKQKKTGLVRLLNTADCVNNSKVVDVSESCTSSILPGSGASFSFRVRNYRMPDLADITLKGNIISSDGGWQHTIFVEVGEIGLDTISLQTRGLQYLNNIQPAHDYKSARKMDTNLSNSVMRDGFIYTNRALVRENGVYIIRSVAYNGKLLKFIGGQALNVLAFDKRKDVIVAFKVVKIDADGSVTILWKQLAEKNSPKIEIESDQKVKVSEKNYTAKKQ